MADMAASIAGVRALYGDDGFSARVRSKSGPLDTRLTSQLADCAAKVTAIPPTFAETLTKDTAAVQATYTSCKDLKATWNTEITSALGATLKPSENDGD